MVKTIKLCPRINSNNKQINFSLQKGKLPLKIKKQLSHLKSINLDWEDFEFE